MRRLAGDVAPIDPAEAALGWNIVRAAGGAVVAAIGIAAVVWDTIGSAQMILPGAVIAGHAVAQLRRPEPAPLGTVLVDASIAGLMILLGGSADVLALVAAVYVVAVAILLLPPLRAAAVLVYTAAWGTAIVLAAPLAPEQGAAAVGSTSTLLTGGLVLAVVIGILAIASRSLLGYRAKQAAAIEAERKAVRLKNEFVSMVSHELRTPLTSIAGFVETLREGWQTLDADSVNEFLNIVHNEAQHLSHLVEDVLVIPRIEAGRLPMTMQRFELRAAVYHVLDVAEREREGGQLAIEIPSGQYVFADPLRTKQVLRNLLTNAFKYGGDQVLVAGERVGDMYQIVVADNGLGVDEEDRGRIFDHFEQVSRGDARTSSGIGLGLPIARHLVRAMGGEVWYEPRFPTGARFCFTLRLAPAAAAAPPATIGTEHEATAGESAPAAEATG